MNSDGCFLILSLENLKKILCCWNNLVHSCKLFLTKGLKNRKLSLNLLSQSLFCLTWLPGRVLNLSRNWLVESSRVERSLEILQSSRVESSRLNRLNLVDQSKTKKSSRKSRNLGKELENLVDKSIQLLINIMTWNCTKPGNVPNKEMYQTRENNPENQKIEKNEKHICF